MEFYAFDWKKQPFKATFSMLDEAGRHPFCKKESRNKFKKLITVKIVKDQHYEINVDFTPPQVVESVNIRGETVLVIEKSREEMSCVYSFQFSTHGLEPSSKGTRHHEPIHLMVTNVGEMQTELQTKVYSRRRPFSEEPTLTCWEVDYSPSQAEFSERYITKDSDDTPGMCCFLCECCYCCFELVACCSEVAACCSALDK